MGELENIVDVKGGLRHNIVFCEEGTNMNNIPFIISYWFKKTNIKNAYIPNDIIIIIKHYHLHKCQLYATGIDQYCDLGQNGHGTNKVNKKKWNIIDTLSDKLIIHISCGKWHSLFLDNNGVIYSCGDNEFGQLGFGHNKTFSSLPPSNTIFCK